MQSARRLSEVARLGAWMCAADSRQPGATATATAATMSRTGGKTIGPDVNRILFVKVRHCFRLNRRPITYSSWTADSRASQNLNYKTRGDDLYDLFGKYGAVRQIRLGNEAKTRGTAFVVYEDVADVGLLLSLSHTLLKVD